LVKFLVFGAVFEKIVHISNGHPAVVYFYIGGLIALGIWIILSPVIFKGRKLKGRYCLLHFKPEEKNWLFFKIKEK